ncbi:MAG TPA: hypothetical protein VMV81_10935 [Phycisphaerae bacterium]|nr:hypothetical protein [Phycisphaerae bacterium]
MPVPYLFWLALALPGYALLRRFFPREVQSGFPGVIALSYLLALALLSPISIACYLTNAPVAVFSGAIVILILISTVEVIRRGWFRDLSRMLLAAGAIELLILVAALVIDARVGSFVNSDAKVHLARLRFLLDHGLTNHDPYLADQSFFPIYHTNLVHALYAACAQVTRTEPILVWFESLPFALLLVACGTYYMAWCVFRRHWPAWIAALFTIGVRGPFTYLIYPNQLAPYFLFPMLIGFAVAACRRPRAGAAIQLATCSLVMGQFHGLYVVFALITVGPAMAAVAIARLVRRRPDRWLLVACTICLAAGAPFALISSLKTPAGNVAAPDQPVSLEAGGYLLSCGDHWVMRHPASLRENLVGLITLVAGLAIALYGRDRASAGIVGGILGATLAWLYLPPLCTLLLRALGEVWILQRFDFLIGLCAVVLVPATLASVIDLGCRNFFIRALVCGLAVVAGAWSAGHTKPEDWETMLGTARNLAAARRNAILSIFPNREFFRQHLLPGQVVLTDLTAAIDLVAVHDCFVIATDRAIHGASDLAQRRRELAMMLASETPWPERQELLREYHVSYMWARQVDSRWAADRSEKAWQLQGRVLYKLRVDDGESQASANPGQR